MKNVLSGVLIGSVAVALAAAWFEKWPTMWVAFVILFLVGFVLLGVISLEDKETKRYSAELEETNKQLRARLGDSQ